MKKHFFTKKNKPMKTLNFVTEVTIYSGKSELTNEVNHLIELARESAQKAYAPYSGFKVGAAILLNNGAVITANNQENAAFPSGLCAERNAAYYASSQYPEVPFSKIAIASLESLNGQPVTPCGACRQVLLEYENKFNQDIEVILASPEEQVYIFSNVAKLLPFCFSSSYLRSS